MAHQGAFKRLRMKYIRSAHSKTLTSLRMALTEDRGWETSHAPFVRFCLTMRNFSKKENLQDRPARNLREVLPQMHLTASKRWDRHCQQDLPVASMEDLGAKIWSNSGITTLTSLVMPMIRTYQRIAISHLLLRPSQREAALNPQPQASRSINHNQRRRELKKILLPILDLIHLLLMKMIRRRRRHLKQV